MLGRVLNTHQQWLCAQLANLGYEVARQIAVPDTGPAIQQAVQESLTRADLIITTGGLGPTSDDITRDLIAQLLGRKLILDSAVLAKIESFFTNRHRQFPASARVQAMIPEGAIVLPNANGTAPGLAIKIPRGVNSQLSTLDSQMTQWLIMLPGPPRELRPMFSNSVIPLLAREFPLADKFICRTFKTTGLGESIVEEKISGPLQSLVESGLEIGYCARVGEVDVRIVTRGENAEKILAQAAEKIQELLGPLIFGVDDDSLEAVVVRLLTEQKKTLALAESCTGGLIAHRLTNVPGASAVLMGGIVSYSNEAKQNFLGVRAESLAEHGAVSKTVAREMAEGARIRNKTDFAIAVTGIAGPTGGSEQKPVGTVVIALASEQGTTAQRFLNPYDRETFKFVTSQQALDLLRRAL